MPLTDAQLAEYRALLAQSVSQRAMFNAPETECCAGTYVFLRGLNAGLEQAAKLLKKVEDGQ